MRCDFTEKRNLLFDLDGTLTDPKEGITKSAAYALSKLGIAVPDLDQLRPFIGPPLKDAFMAYYALSEADALQAVQYYRERYAEVGMFENRLYAGIPELLEALCSAGKRLYLATSKPEVFAVRILAHFQLDGYFTFLGGSTLDHTRDKKEEVVRYVLSSCAIENPSETLMIGDREHDVLGARACGLETLGVLYGFGSKEELTAAGAAGIAADLPELRRMLLRNLR